MEAALAIEFPRMLPASSAADVLSACLARLKTPADAVPQSVRASLGLDDKVDATMVVSAIKGLREVAVVLLARMRARAIRNHVREVVAEAPVKVFATVVLIGLIWYALFRLSARSWPSLASLTATCHQRGHDLVTFLRANLVPPTPSPAR